MQRSRTVKTETSMRTGARLLGTAWTLALVCWAGPALAEAIPLPKPPTFPTPITPSCGDTIGPNGSYILTADVGPCSTNPALTITGSVSVSLGGHSVYCKPGRDSRVGIKIRQSGVWLGNGYIKGCKAALYAEGASENEISRIKATGVTVSRFSEGASVFDLGGMPRIVNSHHNFVHDSTFVGVVGLDDDETSTSSGLSVDVSDHVLRNTVRTVGVGIQMVSDVASPPEQPGEAASVVEHNDVSDTIYGFITLGNNSLRYNKASTSETAFLIRGNFNVLTHNTAKGNIGDGFVVNDEGDIIEANYAGYNGGTGFDLAQAPRQRATISRITRRRTIGSVSRSTTSRQMTRSITTWPSRMAPSICLTISSSSMVARLRPMTGTFGITTGSIR